MVHGKLFLTIPVWKCGIGPFLAIHEGATLCRNTYLQRPYTIYDFKNKKQIILLINFIFAQIYFLIASSQIFKNHAILTNHGSFFWEKDSLQLDRFQFSKMNSLMTEIIKKQFFKTKFL